MDRGFARAGAPVDSGLFGECERSDSLLVGPSCIALFIPRWWFSVTRQPLAFCFAYGAVHLAAFDRLPARPVYRPLSPAGVPARSVETCGRRLPALLVCPSKLPTGAQLHPHTAGRVRCHNKRARSVLPLPASCQILRRVRRPTRRAVCGSGSAAASTRPASASGDRISLH